MDNRRFLLPNDNRILGGIKYEILRVVGSGSSTIVYEAAYTDGLNKEYSHKVLIKELYPYNEKGLIYRNEKGFICWESAPKRMMEDYKYFFRKGNEMNIRLLESNPESVSGNLNSFEEYGTYYSILPLHGGETLEKVMEDKTEYTLKEAAVIIMQILDALALFHENDMLNLDISPDNILLLDGRAMFIDYNSAWDLKDEGSNCFLSLKEGYTAPEILLQDFDEISYCSDLFSVTAVLYHMIFGLKYDLNDRGWEKIESKITESSYNELPSSIQNHLCTILKRGLHPLCDRRFQTIEEYREQLNGLMDELEAENAWNRSSYVKAFAGGMTAVLAIILAAIIGKYLVENKPWLSKIIASGNTNANIYNKARACLADKQYEYYVDQDGNLVMCTYDEKTQTFDPTQVTTVFSQNEEVEGDGVDFLNLGADQTGKANKLYFCYYGGENNPDCIMSMDLDGTNQKTVFTQEDNMIGDYYSYAHLSDNREFIYYMIGQESDEGGYADDYALWRYDLAKDENEKLVDTSVQWFNVYDRYIYYIEYDYDAEAYHLMRATLDGKGNTLLDAGNEFVGGFVQDDLMYLERYLDNEYSIKSCDLKGNIIYDKQGVYGLDLYGMEIGYDNGWIFYSREGQSELRKVRLDGTADKLIYEGMDCYGINCIGNDLFVSAAETNGEELLENDNVSGDYMIERNGASCTKVK